MPGPAWRQRGRSTGQRELLARQRRGADAPRDVRGKLGEVVGVVGAEHVVGAAQLEQRDQPTAEAMMGAMATLLERPSCCRRSATNRSATPWLRAAAQTLATQRQAGSSDRSLDSTSPKRSTGTPNTAEVTGIRQRAAVAVNEARVGVEHLRRQLERRRQQLADVWRHGQAGARPRAG